MPQLAALDHLVLTVRDIASTVGFYRDILGMRLESFQSANGTKRTALTFGCQKINLHKSGSEFRPHAASPSPGSADLCFLSATPLTEWMDHFTAHKVPVIEGPIARTGATGPLLSIYIRDPDENLIEISNQV